MKRLLFLLFFSALAICGPAYGHTLEATSVSENGVEAVLRDTVTGNEWVVQVGDEIDGYRIVEISLKYVTIAKPGENRSVYVTEIPIQGGQQAIEVSP